METTTSRTSCFIYVGARGDVAALFIDVDGCCITTDFFFFTWINIHWYSEVVAETSSWVHVLSDLVQYKTRDIPPCGQSALFYLADGSRLWMVVMKMSTMKAHTRLDLNTSSLICEYCNMSRRERRRKRRWGKDREVFRVKKATGQTRETCRGPDTDAGNGSTTSVRERARERERQVLVG